MSRAARASHAQPAPPVMPSLARSGLWFLVVGSSAAAVHALVFGLTRHALWPEVANAAGFGVAFFVSWAGHRWLSFRGAGTGVRESLLRFAGTALAGFVTNEIVFLAVLRGLGWPSWLALVAGMGAAAVQTFILGRQWAFRRRAP